MDRVLIIKEDIVAELSAVKGGWFPSTFNGIPTIMKVRVPLTVDSD
ncbi:hypothetical protein [Chryseobacterium pennipullorum]|nr:hypothetical protein [Chryseobacterium pennipullorum]